MELTSFLLYGEQLEQLETLNMEQRGMLLTVLMKAAIGKMPELSELDPVVCVAFSFIWAQVQRDKKKFADTSAARSAAGAAGATSRWQSVAKDSKSKQTVTKRGKAKQSTASDGKVSEDMANDDSEWQNMANDGKTWQSMANAGNASQKWQNETENETDSVKKESKKKKAAAPAAASGLLPPLDEAQAERLNAAFMSFSEMRKKIRAPLTEDAARLIVETLKKLATIDGRFDVDLAVKIMNQSTERSWRGIFPLKDDAAAAASPAPAAVHKPNAFHNFDQRRPDYEAIMQAARDRERMEQEARSG